MTLALSYPNSFMTTLATCYIYDQNIDCLCKFVFSLKIVCVNNSHCWRDSFYYRIFMYIFYIKANLTSGLLADIWLKLSANFAIKAPAFGPVLNSRKSFLKILNPFSLSKSLAKHFASCCVLQLFRKGFKSSHFQL